MLHHLCLTMMYILFMSSSGTVQGYATPFSLSDDDTVKEVIGTIEEADFSIPRESHSGPGLKHAFVMSSIDGFALFTETSVVLSFLGELNSEYEEYLVAGTMIMEDPTYYISELDEYRLAISGTVCEVEESKECKEFFLTIQTGGHYHFVDKDVWCKDIFDCLASSVLLYANQECGVEAFEGPPRELDKPFDTVHECLATAMQTDGCGDSVMWSEEHRLMWGCQCCAINGASGGPHDSNWAVWTAPSAPTPSQPTPAGLPPTSAPQPPPTSAPSPITAAPQPQPTTATEPVQPTAVLLYANQECGVEASEGLGKSFDTVHECMATALQTDGCGDSVMWSEEYSHSIWGCYCCTSNGANGGPDNSNWAVWTAPSSPPSQPTPCEDWKTSIVFTDGNVEVKRRESCTWLKHNKFNDMKKRTKVCNFELIVERDVSNHRYVVGDACPESCDDSCDD